MFLEFFNIDFSFAVSDAIGDHDGNKFTVLQNGLRYFLGMLKRVRKSCRAKRYVGTCMKKG